MSMHKKLGHYDLFDDLFLSTNLKLAKPDKRIFEYCISTLKVKPKECVFIDDKKENVKAAKALGINSIRFVNARQLKKEVDAIIRAHSTQERSRR